MLAGAKLSLLDKDGNRSKEFAAKGHKFTFGYYMSCDFTMEDETRAQGVHCEIRIDAFGRVTIHNHCEEHPISVNDEAVLIKRPLFNESIITVLGRRFLWEFPRSRSFEADDVSGGITPSKQGHFPEQASNSCPGLKCHRSVPPRMTIHNFSYCIQSDEDGNTSAERLEEPTTDLKECINDATVSSSLRAVTPEPQSMPSTVNLDVTPKMNLIASTQNKENTSTQKNKRMLTFCKQSEVVITSFSPRVTGVQIEKSFMTLLKPTTPMSVYCTPKSVLSEMNDDEESKDIIDFSTPTTSQKPQLNLAKNSSMHLIDLTSPKRLWPASPHPQAALKASARKNRLITTGNKLINKGQADEQLGVSTLPVTPKSNVDNKKVVTGASSESMICLDSSDLSSSVIEVSDSTPVLSTPLKGAPKMAELKPTQKPLEANASLIKRAFLTGTKQPPPSTRIKTPSKPLASKLTTSQLNRSDRIPVPTKKATATRGGFIAHSRPSLATPSRLSMIPKAHFGSRPESTASTVSARAFNASRTAAATLLTSTPLTIPTSTSRLRRTAKTSPLHGVRKSFTPSSGVSQITKARRAIPLNRVPTSRSAKLVSKARKSIFSANKTISSIPPVDPVVPKITVHFADIQPKCEDDSDTLNRTFTKALPETLPVADSMNNVKQAAAANAIETPIDVTEVKPASATIFEPVDKIEIPVEGIVCENFGDVVGTATATVEAEDAVIPIETQKQEEASASTVAPTRVEQSDVEVLPNGAAATANDQNGESETAAELNGTFTLSPASVKDSEHIAGDDAATTTTVAEKASVEGEALPVETELEQTVVVQTATNGVARDDNAHPSDEQSRWVAADQQTANAAESDRTADLLQQIDFVLNKSDELEQKYLSDVEESQRANDSVVDEKESPVDNKAPKVEPETSQTADAGESAAVEEKENLCRSPIVMKTTSAIAEPKTPNLCGLREIMQTPKRTAEAKTPHFAGLRELMRTPKAPLAAADDKDSEALDGVPALLQTPAAQNAVDAVTLTPGRCVSRASTTIDADTPRCVTRRRASVTAAEAITEQILMTPKRIITRRPSLDDRARKTPTAASSSAARTPCKTPRHKRVLAIDETADNMDAIVEDVADGTEPKACSAAEEMILIPVHSHAMDTLRSADQSVVENANCDVIEESICEEIQTSKAAPIDAATTPEAATDVESIKEVKTAEGDQPLVKEIDGVAANVLDESDYDYGREVAQDAAAKTGVMPLNSAVGAQISPEGQQAPSTPCMRGVRELLQTPKALGKTPRFVGLRQLVRTPKPNDYSEAHLEGVAEVMQTPQAATKSTDIDEEIPTTSGTIASGEFLGMRELLKTPKGNSTPRLAGVREMLQTPKPVSCATPRLAGIKELLATPKLLPLPLSQTSTVHSVQLTDRSMQGKAVEEEESDEGLDRFFTTPRAKNVMIPNAPSSAIIEKSVDSVELLQNTEYSLNDTGVAENLHDLFKTPVATRFTEAAAGNETTETPKAAEDVKNSTADEAFDKLSGRASTLLRSPLRKVYAHKGNAFAPPSPFSASDVISDLPKTDVQDWVDQLADNEEPNDTSQLNEIANQEDEITFSDADHSRVAEAVNPLSVSATNSTFGAETMIDDIEGEGSFRAVDPLAKSAMKAASLTENVQLEETATPASADISGINLLDETQESIIEPLVVSDEDESIDESIKEEQEDQPVAEWQSGTSGESDTGAEEPHLSLVECVLEEDTDNDVALVADVADEQLPVVPPLGKQQTADTSVLEELVVKESELPIMIEPEEVDGRDEGRLEEQNNEVNPREESAAETQIIVEPVQREDESAPEEEAPERKLATARPINLECPSAEEGEPGLAVADPAQVIAVMSDVQPHDDVNGEEADNPTESKPKAEPCDRKSSQSKLSLASGDEAAIHVYADVAQVSEVDEEEVVVERGSVSATIGVVKTMDYEVKITDRSSTEDDVDDDAGKMEITANETPETTTATHEPIETHTAEDTAVKVVAEEQPQTVNATPARPAQDSVGDVRSASRRPQRTRKGSQDVATPRERVDRRRVRGETAIAAVEESKNEMDARESSTQPEVEHVDGRQAAKTLKRTRGKTAEKAIDLAAHRDQGGEEQPQEAAPSQSKMRKRRSSQSEKPPYATEEEHKAVAVKAGRRQRKNTDDNQVVEMATTTTTTTTTADAEASAKVPARRGRGRKKPTDTIEAPPEMVIVEAEAVAVVDEEAHPASKRRALKRTKEEQPEAVETPKRPGRKQKADKAVAGGNDTSSTAEDNTLIVAGKEARKPTRRVGRPAKAGQQTSDTAETTTDTITELDVAAAQEESAVLEKTSAVPETKSRKRKQAPDTAADEAEQPNGETQTQPQPANRRQPARKAAAATPTMMTPQRAAPRRARKASALTVVHIVADDDDDDDGVDAKAEREKQPQAETAAAQEKEAAVVALKAARIIPRRAAAQQMCNYDESSDNDPFMQQQRGAAVDAGNTTVTTLGGEAAAAAGTVGDAPARRQRARKPIATVQQYLNEERMKGSGSPKRQPLLTAAAAEAGVHASTPLRATARRQRKASSSTSIEAADLSVLIATVATSAPPVTAKRAPRSGARQAAATTEEEESHTMEDTAEAGKEKSSARGKRKASAKTAPEPVEEGGSSTSKKSPKLEFSEEQPTAAVNAKAQKKTTTSTTRKRATKAKQQEAQEADPVVVTERDTSSSHNEEQPTTKPSNARRGRPRKEQNGDGDGGAALVVLPATPTAQVTRRGGRKMVRFEPENDSSSATSAPTALAAVEDESAGKQPVVSAVPPKRATRTRRK